MSSMLNEPVPNNVNELTFGSNKKTTTQAIPSDALCVVSECVCVVPYLYSRCLCVVWVNLWPYRREVS